MLEILDHGDVRELRFSNWRSRRAGYAVSAFVTRGTLVDAAYPRAAHELAAYVRAHPVGGAVLTHAHEDHSGGVPALAALGIPVHCADSTDAAMRAPERVGMYRRLIWGTRRRLTIAVPRFTHADLTLVPTPGHSADHHVVWDAERETVFGGDLFIGVKMRLAHYDEDVRGQVPMLRRVAALRPRRFFDAHRGALRDPVAQLTAKAEWMTETIGRIEDLVGRGWSDDAIRRAVLGPEDLTGVSSFGNYSRRNFVRSVRATMAAAGPAVGATSGGASA
jgi:glyoxylase-like metal-dependent hydrolase (beta-lactamase superfamily II)